MRHFKSRRLALIAWMTIGLLLVPVISHAAACEPWAAKLVSLQGSVEIRRAAGVRWESAELETLLCPGDMVRVNKFSRAALVLANNALVRLDQRTTILLDGPRPRKPFLVNLIEGLAYFFSRFPQKLEIVTPFVNAAIEGTEFTLSAVANHSLLTMIEGRVRVQNAAGSLSLKAGEAAIARSGMAPRPVLVTRPRDAVHWALYYPPIIYWQPADFAGAPGSWQLRDPS